MLVEELWIEVDGTRQTIHVRGLDDTVLVGIAYGHAVRHVGQRAGEADVMVGAYGCAVDFLLPVGVITADGACLRTAGTEFLIDKLLETLCRHHIHILGAGADLHVSGV